MNIEKMIKKLCDIAPDYDYVGGDTIIIGRDGFAWMDGFWRPSMQELYDYFEAFGNFADYDFSDMPEIREKFFKNYDDLDWQEIESIFWDNYDEIDEIARKKYMDVLLEYLTEELGSYWGTAWHEAEEEEIERIYNIFFDDEDEEDEEDNEDDEE